MQLSLRITDGRIVTIDVVPSDTIQSIIQKLKK